MSEINNYGYALAWNENQGSYSSTIAKKTLAFAANQGLKINTVLDICCGSANFLNEMNANGKICTGTEILDSYVEFNKNNYKNINFVKTRDVLDFDNLGKFDLISCNHDVINYLPTLEDWSTMFKQVYRHLNNGGIFIFDYYSKRKLQHWNEVTFDENEKLDYIRNVVSDGISKTTIENIYYVKLNNLTDNSVSAMDRTYSYNDTTTKFKRSAETLSEYYFDNDLILEEIKKAGYRYLITTDASFAPVASISDMNRVHIIAIKLEK